MTRKVVICGSRSFPIDATVGTEVVDLMVGYGEDVVFLTRGSDGFDRFVMQAGPLIGRRVFAYPSNGGADNYLRDIELVKDGDEVLVFLDPDSLTDPNTGSAHLLEVALRSEKPTRAYTTVNGGLVYAGATQEEA